MTNMYDTRRGKEIRLTPEERVRLSLLRMLEEDLGYPKELITVERGLREVSGDSTAPNRRIDILAYEKGSMAPILLIECKAVPLKESMLDQVYGYNHFVGARSICLVNESQCIVGIKNGESYSFQSSLPTYRALTSKGT